MFVNRAFPSFPTHMVSSGINVLFLHAQDNFTPADIVNAGGVNDHDEEPPPPYTP